MRAETRADTIDLFEEALPLTINEHGVVLEGPGLEVITDHGTHKGKYLGFEIFVAQFSVGVWRSVGCYYSNSGGFSSALSVSARAYNPRDRAVLGACQEITSRLSEEPKTPFISKVLANIAKVAGQFTGIDREIKA
jgi:hypothetical protein